MRKLKHAEIERPSLQQLALLKRFPISILLDDIRSAHNVGSIIRTADAVRAEHVFMTGVSPDATHAGVNKAALGAQDAISWSHERHAADLARSLKNRGVTLIALEQTVCPTPIESLTTSIFPVCLMVGNEVAGLRDELIDLADYAIELPQYGIKQSLNVSVATGIALYDLLRLYLSRESQDATRVPDTTDRIDLE